MGATVTGQVNVDPGGPHWYRVTNPGVGVYHLTADVLVGPPADASMGVWVGTNCDDRTFVTATSTQGDCVSFTLTAGQSFWPTVSLGNLLAEGTAYQFTVKSGACP